MKFFVKILFFGFIVLQSCKSNNYTEIDKVKGEKNNTKSFVFHIPNKIESIFPLKATSKEERLISSQVYESLFRYNSQDLRLENNLIKSYTIDSTNTEYTFILKDSIYFHNNRCFKNGIGRKLTSKDIIYCISNLCEKNRVFSKIIAKPTVTNDSLFAGLKYVNELEFIINLKQPTAGFEHLFTQTETGIYPKEIVLYSYQEKINQEVGTGPFKLKSVSSKLIKLEKNDNYHLNNGKSKKLPLLQKLNFLVEPNNDSALHAFQNGKIDFINQLDSDLIFDLQFNKYIGISNIDIHHQPDLSFDYIGVNLNDSIMQNPLLRKSIAYSINKKQLLEKALHGEADHPANNGLTPQCMKEINNYDVKLIKSIGFNIDSAQKYFELSNSFDSLSPKNITLYYDKEDKRHQHIAVELSKQLKNSLNIDLLNEPCTAEKLNEAIENHTAVIYIQTLNYDITHPIDALKKLESLPYIHTDKVLNYSKWIDSANFYPNKTFEYCQKAESLLINQSIIIPLWSNENYEIIQPDVKNLYINALQYYDFRTTNLDKIEQLLPVNN